MPATMQEIALKKLYPNPDQPRKQFNEAELSKLADSIKSYGVLEPLVVCPNGKPGKFLIVAGERRFRASQEAGLKKVPCRLLPPLSPEEIFELSVLENVQRADMTPFEEGFAYSKLLCVSSGGCRPNDKGYTQQQLSEKIGKSAATIRDKLCLLDCIKRIREAVEGGLISESHARALATLDSGTQNAAFSEVKKRGLDARATAALCVRMKEQAEQVSMFEVESVKKSDLSEKVRLEKALHGAADLIQRVNEKHEGEFPANACDDAMLDKLDMVLRGLKNIRDQVNNTLELRGDGNPQAKAARKKVVQKEAGRKAAETRARRQAQKGA